MKKYYNSFASFSERIFRRRGMRIFFRIVSFLIVALTAAYIGLASYIYYHKKEVLAQVVATLNEDLTGTLSIGSMEPTFIQGFPRISLRLNTVTLHDSLFPVHKRTFLTAGAIDLSVNTLALLRGTILIKKVSLRNAVIDMYTDKVGYSNSNVFKRGKGSTKKSDGSFPELRQFALRNVAITIDNKQKLKLYKFTANDLAGEIDYTMSGWNAEIELNTLVHSLAFNTKKGSFIKNRIVEGNLDIAFDEDEGKITFARDKMIIGGENFTIGASFMIGSSARFAINIENKKIMWRNASNLLSPNISRKLDMFDLKSPIAVKCDLVGDFNVAGDPLIRVNADVKDNTLTSPGGTVEKCSFFGVFTNNHIKSLGFNDANSAIKIFSFKGSYSSIPIELDNAFILNLENPVATGNFKSGFDLNNLENLVDEDLLKFSSGSAEVQLKFRADIVNFKLAKPYVSGFVKIKDANVSYIPRSLTFNDIDVSLDFTEQDLYISRIDLKSGKSVVEMEGNIKNFLNLYYTAPEKIVLNWNVYSPQLHLGEFMGFVGSRKATKTADGKAKAGNFTKELNELFEKSNVDMKLRVDKLFYNKFYATKAHANVLLTGKGVIIKNAALNHGGGSIKVDGRLDQGRSTNSYAVAAIVNNVNISTFFNAFDNFSMETLKAENLKGFLSSTATISGKMTNDGAMVPRSMDGSLGFTLREGALLNFEPIRRVGKIAFPNRDINTITIETLKGKFDVKGEKVIIYPMQVNSSVLNMDIAGIYSFGRGTSIGVDVPLRNPKRDEGIDDEAELAKRRNRGIVVHLVAEDDKYGQVKVKLGKKRDND